ncbi:phage tail tape measure protein [Herbiconiux sp. KACC 21604]|uniref:phage tail tape measure protein n=1 Tax=unclassified Herbiconiux TaxID=2618217 RepID=UPI0014923299|nr:phage tail tape measure protein [Herbiconiux sp. SALV-R1]QJU54331.1 phage tail tape measure protein [Herbiconiux sp. SALV-R1]WPO85401.1 phage tail tape measure protein [Herbiconiux sp. KACC 21604]
MTDRTVKVSLLAQATGFINGLQQARKEVRETGSELEKLAQKRQSFETIGRSALAFGAAVAFGVGLAVSSFATFDQSMSYVQASTHETAGNMGLLRDAALEAGAATVFSATESANAIDELAKAGISTGDIVGGALTGSLDLAAAGGLGVARAAEISATTLQQFSLRGSDAAHVADVLAAGAGKAMGSVDDLAQAMKFVGPVAASIGISLDETAGVLALFAQQGILGEQAGTSLRGVIASLTSPSSLAGKEIERLNLTLFDSNGKFLGLTNAAGELSRAYATMDDQARLASMGVIFGRETITAATALYKEGATGVTEWTDAVNDSGYASDTAAMRLDNLKGDVEQLTGAIDTGLIQAGSAANDLLRFLAQSATDTVDRFNDLPQPLQSTGLAIGVVTGAASLAYGAFMVGVPKIAEYKTALADLGPTAQRTARALGAVTKGAAVGAGIVIGIDLLNTLLEKLEATDEQLKNTAITATDANDLIADGLQGILKSPSELVTGVSVIDDFQGMLNNLADTSENWFATFAHGTDGTNDLNVALNRIGETLAQVAATDPTEAVEAFQLLVDKTDGSDRSINELLNRMPAYKEALRAQASAAGLSADQQTLVALALGEIGGASTEAADGIENVTSAAEVASQNLDDLADSVRGYDDAISNAISTTSAFYQSVDDAKELFGKDGFERSLDLTTQAGRDNMAALLDIADAANEMAAVTFETTGSQDELIGKLNEGRQALYDQARQFFDTDEAAWGYVDQLMQTPEQITTQVTLNGVDEAMAKAQEILALLNEVERPRQTSVGVTVDSPFYNPDFDPLAPRGGGGGSFANANGGLHAYANGGFPTGIYAGRKGAIHKFAEPETGWEAYISGRRGQESRNRGIWAEAGRRLGAWQSAPMQYGTQVSSQSTDAFTYAPTIQPGPGLDAYGIARSTLSLAQFERKVQR